MKHKLTRALGHLTQVAVDVQVKRIQPRDTLLMVTDGVTRHLSAAQLADCLDLAPRAWVEKMIIDANRAGGRDNISVMRLTVGSLLKDARALEQHLDELEADGLEVVLDLPPQLFEETIVHRPATSRMWIVLGGLVLIILILVVMVILLSWG